MADALLPSITWIVVLGAFAAFLFGFGTGANDVANAFGTSVGAKTLTLRQAVIIAVIFEFTGAMVLGRVSTDTIAGGIADVTVFQREPEFYAYGMFCALSVSGFWQIFCSYLELNVSSTHSIIGSIIGFAMIYGGSKGVLWQVPDPGSFPPYKGFVPIVVSWFFSPIFTGIVAAVIMTLSRYLVLRRKNAYTLSYWVLPVMVLITVFVCVYFVLTKGAKKLIQSEDNTWESGKAQWVSAVVAAGCAVVTIFIGLPLMRWQINKKFASEDEGEATPSPTGSINKALPDVEENGAKVNRTQNLDGTYTVHHHDNWAPRAGAIGVWDRVVRAATYGTSMDVHEVVEEDPIIAAIHANAEKFPMKAEYVYSYLQVFSAICVIFAHGAGEVGYMAGPLATIWNIQQTGTLAKKVNADPWVVVIGALGLVFGLATYGYNVTRAMGVRLAKLSPSRGFAAELATALVIMITSQYGLPTSSSQCITGGIIGVGALEGSTGVNWVFFGKIFLSWIITLIFCGLATAAMFAQACYAPSIPMGIQQRIYEDEITKLVTAELKAFNTTATSYTGLITAGSVTGVTAASLSTLQKSITALSAAQTKLTSTSTQTAEAYVVLRNLYKTLKLIQQNSILTFGQNALAVTAPQVCYAATNASQAAACVVPTLVTSAMNITFP